MAKKQSNDCILQFDLAEEVFGLIAAPPQDGFYHRPEEYHAGSHVLVLNDHLAAVTIVLQFSPGVVHIDHIDVWMMTEYGLESSWTKIHSCQLHLEGRLARVLGMSFSRADDGGTTIDRISFEHAQRSSKNLISCDASGVIRHRNFKHQWACWKPLGLSPYVDTLQPVSLQL